MEYLADTVAIIRYLSESSKVGKTALSILTDADNGKNKIIVSAISLMEIMYLYEKGRIKFSLNDFLEKIENHKYYKVIDLNTNILLSAIEIKNVELHDRLLIATAKHLDIPILTCDKVIQKNNLVKTIWD